MARRRPEVPPDGQMPLVEHLYELRSRLGRALLAVGAGLVLVFVFWEPVYDFLRQPYCSTDAGRAADCELLQTGVFQALRVRLRVAFIGGIVLASPVWLYQLGAFITPALHRKEKRYAGGFLAASLTLFAVGAAFAYLTISRGLDFLLQVGGGDVVTLVSIDSYLSFFTLCLLAFGIAFEFPVVVMFLHLAGVLSSAKMRSARRGTILGIFAASALITPSQDPFTFVVMAVPLCLMYEGCIVIARIRERRQRARAGAEPDDDTPTFVDPRPSPI